MTEDTMKNISTRINTAKANCIGREGYHISEE